MRGIRCTLGIVLATTLLAASGRSEDTLPPPAAEPASAVEPADVPYDPVGRRDPFRPPRTAGVPGGEGLTPLQRYDVGQLRLVAVIYETSDPRAVVEDDQGLGYIVKLGTLIGPNGGKVSAIERGKVVIAEDDAEFAPEGANKVTMELRPSADETPRRASERGKR